MIKLYTLLALVLVLIGFGVVSELEYQRLVEAGQHATDQK